MAFAYTVRCAFDDVAVMRAFAEWLEREHVALVCEKGSATGEISFVDGQAVVAARYVFDSRDAFAAYEANHAPQMRADGLAELERLGVAPGRGVTMTRETGELVRPRRG